MPPATFVGVLAAALAVVITLFASSRADESRVVASESVLHTFEVLEQVARLRLSMKDAETGQRGYLLTGDEKYLAPYLRARDAVDEQLRTAQRLMVDNPRQVERLSVVERVIADKMSELAETIKLRREGNAEKALAIVRTDRGKEAMDQFRSMMLDVSSEEQQLLGARQDAAQKAAALARAVSVTGSIVLLVLISAMSVLLARDHRVRETAIWMRGGVASLVTTLQGELTTGQVGANALQFLSSYLGVQVGSAYAADDHGRFQRVAGFALPSTHHGEGPAVRTGDGLIGEVIRGGRALHVREVPPGYLPVSSSLGQADARQLLVLPLRLEGLTVGVIELGFFRALSADDLELVNRVGEPLAFALASSQYKARLRTLLEESQRQAEELASQQAELESQQAEVEASNEELNQTNAIMELQTQELEGQRDELSRAREEAERASRYKSEFLANMSHELRTPLNSALILARLLADNREGNLSADQVRSAETIYGAGNDLLVLINDILDLSKVEAGHVDLVLEPVVLSRVSAALERSFRPLADQKHLGFRVVENANCPPRIFTDGRRLEQILKNLLSNAFKFTTQGEVVVTIDADSKSEVRFAVRDTGIGIAAAQHEVIFDAFRQADGTTSRKYGGTGLGLSISRELARLLGGRIDVQSVVGQGSTFSLIVPVEGKMPEPAPSVQSRAASPAAPAVAARSHRPAKASAAAIPSASLVGDDRGRALRPGRLIVVVEDDEAFARILLDLAHELDFDCLVACTADEGLTLAREHQPSGILLDVGLPDASGLSVLERLKRAPSTRHIPVHMVSVSDNVHTALEMGAIGYALKPVAREDLVAAIGKLHEQYSREVRRVLIVEDDARQRDSIRQLLRGHGVELVLAGTVREALTELERTSFDCMVLDLSLPDGSGHDLLEKMAEGTRFSFPPVIVYTGRELARGDEERLRRYSQSIIVKGARSPERLLDEVTLFLHQVEAKLPSEQRRMLQDVREREAVFEGRRILVVEDDVRNVFALSKILEPLGAKIEIARNGREALTALSRAGDVDLVLMDLMMPEMDGLTAIREIRKDDGKKRLPIIALTAKAMSDDREEALKAGANDYMSKPFEVEKLISLCRVWLPR